MANNEVFLEVDGIRYDGFENISYFKSIENLSGTFNFTASTQGVKFSPFKGQEKCKIIINNIPVITGFIENLIYSYDSGSHIIQVGGRDKTADVIDNSVFGNVEFKAPISLKNIIVNVLSKGQINQSDILVIDQVGNLQDFKQNELFSAEVGDNMFNYIEKYARKRGVLLSSNGDGDLIITQSGQSKLDGIILNQLNNNSNNVKSASINYDFTERYFIYNTRSQGNFSSAELFDIDGEGLSTLESTVGNAIDTDIRGTRVIEFQNETSSINTSNFDRAKWEANIRRARSQVYICNLAHLFVDKQQTKIYEPNKLIQVIDDFCDINATMLIKSVNYELNIGTGTSVILELVSQDSYLPQIKKDDINLKYNAIGDSVQE